MKINALAHASINQLAVVDLRIEPCHVAACHRFEMKPVPIDRFVYITEGTAVFSFGNETLRAGKNDMVYLPCDTAYRSKWQENADFMVIDLLLHDADAKPIRFDDRAGVLFCDRHGTYRGLLEELASKANASGPFDWLERLSLSFKLLYEMARDTNRTQLDENSRKIKAGLSYLTHNFALDFPIEQLAKMCGMSEGSFRRIFSECMGMSPVEYRNRLRINRATELLKTGEYTVSETADAVGIHDIKYFSKLFKKYAGVTPRAIRKAGGE